MYGALYRLLPGPVWVRVIILVVAAALVLTALALWVFPALDLLIAPRDVTVEQ